MTWYIMAAPYIVAGDARWLVFFQVYSFHQSYGSVKRGTVVTIVPCLNVCSLVFIQLYVFPALGTIIEKNNMPKGASRNHSNASRQKRNIQYKKAQQQQA